MSSYYGSEPWNDEEFSPQTIQLVVREKIVKIKQSRDETLDEYLWYFNSLVTSCPHHGFTNLYLLQRLLGGMTPLEREMLNDAAGGSVMNLTVSETWNLIYDLAARSRPRQDQAEPLEDVTTELASSNQQLANTMHQIQADIEETWANIEAIQKMLKPRVIEEEPTEPAEDENPRMIEEEPAKTGPVFTTKPTEVPELITELPETVPMLAAKMPETCPDLTAELSEKGIVLPTELAEAPELPETDLALVVEVPQLVPSVCMRITAPEDEVINDEVQGELEAKHEPEEPKMEHSLVMSQEKPAENSLVLGWPIISATKKRLGMGTSSRSLVFNGIILNFQNCKGATHSNMKKRPRHGPKEWKPGRRNKRARLDGTAAMVKESSPSRGYVKKKPPDQRRAELSPLPYVFFGQIKRAAEKKFDLTHPWDPTL